MLLKFRRKLRGTVVREKSYGLWVETVMEVSMAMSNWPVFYWNWHIVERLFPNTCSLWLDGRSKHTPEQARRVTPYSPNGKPQMCLATDRTASWGFAKAGAECMAM